MEKIKKYIKNDFNRKKSKLYYIFIYVCFHLNTN